MLTGTSDFRVGHLNNGDRQVAREEAEKDYQYHLCEPPFAALLFEFPDIPSGRMR